MTPRLERVRAYENAKAALAIAQETELAARAAILEFDFPDRTDGTNTLTLDDGRQLKCVVDYEFKTDAERATLCIAKLEAADPDGALLAKRLFRFKPEVAVGELKKLPPKLRRIADRAIEVKPKRPSVAVVAAAPSRSFTAKPASPPADASHGPA